MALRIYNTLTREKEDFAPLIPGKVSMYVCGITPYAASHIGHARSAVAFDMVRRWLARSYEVTFVRNFTDIDDKIIKAAGACGETVRCVSDRYIGQYQDDLLRLRCRPPSLEPKVTDHIPEVIALVERLVARGVAYVVDGDVYFEVARFPAYGALSGRAVDELEAGARVAVDERKKAPQDFALWKSAKADEPSWASPWGRGRPGWHIECSAMAARYLGEVFDIHGGGKDLVFPHHENEIAQSCAASGKPKLAMVWMHNGFVNLMPETCPSCSAELAEPAEKCPSCGYVFRDDDLKMSKSRGNFYPIHEILERFEGEALRCVLLGSHYRTPIQFSHVLLEDTEKRLDKNYETLAKIDAYLKEHTFVPGPGFAATFGFDPAARFREAMDDDFNAAKAIADLSEVFRVANELLHAGVKERLGANLSAADTSRLLVEIREIIRDQGDVLGLWQEDPASYLARRQSVLLAKLTLSPAEIEAKIAERVAARKAKDFKRADAVRDELKALGIVLKDSAKGTEWYAEKKD